MNIPEGTVYDAVSHLTVNERIPIPATPLWRGDRPSTQLATRKSFKYHPSFPKLPATDLYRSAVNILWAQLIYHRPRLPEEHYLPPFRSRI
jgi:hypothetical protein